MVNFVHFFLPAVSKIHDFYVIANEYPAQERGSKVHPPPHPVDIPVVVNDAALAVIWGTSNVQHQTPTRSPATAPSIAAGF
jgi:hypothetical protein